MPSTARRLLRLFRPYRGRLALALVLLLVQGVAPGALVFLVRTVLDDVLLRKDPVQLALLPVAVVGLYALSGAANVARGLLTRGVAWDVVSQVRRDLFRRLLTLGPGWHQQQPSGALTSRLLTDTANLQYAVSGVVTALQKPVTLVVLIGAAVALNPTLALAAGIVLPLVGVPMARFGARLREATRDSQTAMSRLGALAGEAFTGVRVVQAFRGEAAIQARFDDLDREQRDLQMGAFMAQLLPGPVIELIAAVGVGAVIWVGGQQVFAGALTPGELIAFLVAVGLLNDPLKGVAQINALLQRALASAEVLFALLDTPPDVPDTGTVETVARPATLRLEGVCAAYPARGEGQPPQVLQDLSLEIAAGQVVAVVGPSGAGKSTLASLLPRFLDPVAGRILLNGVDLRDYTLGALRGAIAIVSQETFLFDDTIRANLAFGTDATDEAVIAAAKAARAHDFIETLPQGYDTRIDSLGQRLSGGQRQRLCIARAILRDAPILVLDEATSALDAENEALVQQALDQLMRHRTVLVIAHRLSTVQDADRILVLDQGRLVEQGRHGELLERGGVYARLVGRQEG